MFQRTYITEVAVISLCLTRWQRTIRILAALVAFGGSALAIADERDRPAKGSDLNSVVRDASAIQAGKERFSERCVFCHGGAGRGAKGPCLTCGRFRHGGSDASLYANIAGGIPGTQMGAFGTVVAGGDRQHHRVSACRDRPPQNGGRARRLDIWAYSKTTEKTCRSTRRALRGKPRLGS
jgi:mono/diheme cytochrome c family protein